MHRLLPFLRIALITVLAIAAPRASEAQDLQYENLSGAFNAVFNHILTDAFQLSPGEHADHFVPASLRASNELTPALNSLLASNVASFPLSSSVAGITFDFSTGAPVRVVESLGPIFAESGQTVGERKITFSFNATYLSLDNFRSMNLDDLEFSFLHEDVGTPGLGDELSELDVVRVKPGLDANATIFAFSATYGVTSNLDIGIAVPFVNVDLQGTAEASIESYTLPVGGASLHFFGGTPLDPVLFDEVPYQRSAAGIGDIAIRFKYRVPSGAPGGVAAIVDFRLPTGDEAEFIGTGSMTSRILLVGSRRVGMFTPHVNLGYDYRGADLDSDEIEFAIGFDQQLTRDVTFAIDLLGEIDLNDQEAIRLLPGSESITYTDGVSGAVVTRDVPLSNAPDQMYDHTLRTSIGFRAAPTERLQFLANVLISLIDSGLYSNVTPTVGFSVLL